MYERVSNVSSDITASTITGAAAMTFDKANAKYSTPLYTTETREF